MKSICRYVFCGALVLMGGRCAVPQQAVAPPPKPDAAPPQTAASGPSLVDTMKYIEDKLNSIGPVSYTVYPGDGSDSFVLGTYAYRNHHYTADASTCSLTEEFEHQETKYRDVVPLRNVSKIEAATASTFTVFPGSRYVPDPPQVRVSSGAPSIETSFTRPDRSFRKDKHQAVAPMVTEKIMGKEWFVLFDDADAADRTAKALLHAVELCGGGGKKELF